MRILVVNEEKANKPVSTVKTPMSNLSFNGIQKVTSYFSSHNTAKAEDFNDEVSGQFLTSLVKRGYLKIVATEETFIQLDNGLFRKCSINVYGKNSYTANLLNDWVEDYVFEKFDKEIEKGLECIDFAKKQIAYYQHEKDSFLSQFN